MTETTTTEPCPACHATGTIHYSAGGARRQRACGACNGTGRFARPEVVVPEADRHPVVAVIHTFDPFPRGLTRCMASDPDPDHLGVVQRAKRWGRSLVRGGHGLTDAEIEVYNREAEIIERYHWDPDAPDSWMRE